jgi:hypothetical protein
VKQTTRLWPPYQPKMTYALWHFEPTGGSVRVVVEVVQDKTPDMNNWSGLFYIGKGDLSLLPSGKKDQEEQQPAARKIELTSSAMHPAACPSL